MATLNYMNGRRKYGRPQAFLFADNPGIVVNGFHIPEGEEFEDFIILSDDNRDPINFDTVRIEQRERMINGRMRSYHIADKTKISTSWKTLPSRSYASFPDFNNEGRSVINSETGLRVLDPSTQQYVTIPKQFFTTDGGAGGAELLKWYENHQGSFWVYLAYDKYTNFEENPYQRLGQYNEVIEVFFDSFDHTVTKRGAASHDYWDVSLSLEEV
jgi:hypothetical protein